MKSPHELQVMLHNVMVLAGVGIEDVLQAAIAIAEEEAAGRVVEAQEAAEERTGPGIARAANIGASVVTIEERRQRAAAALARIRR